MLHAIAAAWGSLLLLIPNRARATTSKNLQACFPNKAEKEITQLTKSSLQNTVCTGLEMGKAWLPPIEKTLNLVKETEGMEEFRKALATEGGVILLTPHLSNWEIFGFYVCDNIAATCMYQPPKLPGLDRLLRSVRSRSGIHLAPTNRQGVAHVLGALRRGELICILPDQVPPQEGGVYAPFFGEQAFTMTLVSRLVMRTGARVFCGFAKRLPRARGFKVIVKEADELIYSEDLEQSAIGLNRSVEQCVEMAIAQYQWEYKRFRRRPGGEEFYR